MIVAVPLNVSRKVKLFANSFNKELKANILQYNDENLYDVILYDKPNIVLTDNIDLDIFYSLFNDIETTNIITSTKFIVLSDIKKHNYVKTNIKYIENNLYKGYNEYATPKDSDQFIFCVANCNDITINSRMDNILFPNRTIMPIKIVNCTEYKNVHNLGTASEDKVIDLLSRCEIFINTNNEYLYDAIYLKKKIINIVDNDLLPTIQHITDDHINEASVVNSEFLSKYKISNIIKHIIK